MRNTLGLGFGKRYVSNMGNKIMKLSFLKFAPVALLPLIVMSAWMSYHYRQALKSTAPLPYEVVDDGMEPA